MYRSAVLSDDRLMRWELTRVWADRLDPKLCTFLLLNPSTADAETDDPTTVRCMSYARYWRYDGVRLVNLVGFRATDPRDMYDWFAQQTHTGLSEHVKHAVSGAVAPDSQKVIVAHGNLPPIMREHAFKVSAAIMMRRNLHALKLNKDGSPAHPLYLPGDLCPRLYFPVAPHDYERV